MTDKKVYGVLLTDEGWTDLEKPLEPYTSKGPIGKYLYCRKVHPNENYFAFDIKGSNPDGSTFDAEISVPHRYIKFVIGVNDRKAMGFISENG